MCKFITSVPQQEINAGPETEVMIPSGLHALEAYINAKFADPGSLRIHVKKHPNHDSQ